MSALFHWPKTGFPRHPCPKEPKEYVSWIIEIPRPCELPQPLWTTTGRLLGPCQRTSRFGVGFLRHARQLRDYVFEFERVCSSAGHTCRGPTLWDPCHALICKWNIARGYLIKRLSRWFLCWGHKGPCVIVGVEDMLITTCILSENESLKPSLHVGKFLEWLHFHPVAACERLTTLRASLEGILPTYGLSTANFLATTFLSYVTFVHEPKAKDALLKKRWQDVHNVQPFML